LTTLSQSLKVVNLCTVINTVISPPKSLITLPPQNL
jgi:hypothetical protein